MSEKKVDQEWKKRAQAEKKSQSGEAKSRAPGVAPGEVPGEVAGEEPGEARGAPAPSFVLIVSSFAAQALIALGQIESPVEGRRTIDLDTAKFTIDLLQVLSDKTQGNLSEEEKAMLDATLYDLRMQYVDISNRLSAAGA